MLCLLRRLRHRPPFLLRVHAREENQKLYLPEKALLPRLPPRFASPPGHGPRQTNLLFSVCSPAKSGIACNIPIDALMQWLTEVFGKQDSTRLMVVSAGDIWLQPGESTKGGDRLAAGALAILRSKQGTTEACGVEAPKQEGHWPMDVR